MWLILHIWKSDKISGSAPAYSTQEASTSIKMMQLFSGTTVIKVPRGSTMGLHCLDRSLRLYICQTYIKECNRHKQWTSLRSKPKLSVVVLSHRAHLFFKYTNLKEISKSPAADKQFILNHQHARVTKIVATTLFTTLQRKHIIISSILQKHFASNTSRKETDGDATPSRFRMIILSLTINHLRIPLCCYNIVVLKSPTKI